MPRSDFSSSSGLKKLYGNVLIDPPNGFDRSGEFVSVITSCRSASRRCAMYLPEKPKAPVTATRTLAPHQVVSRRFQIRMSPRAGAYAIRHGDCRAALFARQL